MAKKSVTLGTHWEAKMKSTGDMLGTQGRAARWRPPPSFSSTSNCTQAGVAMSVCQPWRCEGREAAADLLEASGDTAETSVAPASWVQFSPSSGCWSHFVQCGATCF